MEKELPKIDLPEEWQKMMSRVKQGLSPTEETVVDSATGTVMSSAGTGGSGSGDSSRIALVRYIHCKLIAAYTCGIRIICNKVYISAFREINAITLDGQTFVDDDGSVYLAEFNLQMQQNSD